MTTHYLNATVRYTECASKIEAFLDDNENCLSPDMFHALDVLAWEIETIENNSNTKIEELENEKDGYINEIDNLREEIEELQSKISELEESK